MTVGGSAIPAFALLLASSFPCLTRESIYTCGFETWIVGSSPTMTAVNIREYIRLNLFIIFIFSLHTFALLLASSFPCLTRESIYTCGFKTWIVGSSPTMTAVNIREYIRLNLFIIFIFLLRTFTHHPRLCNFLPNTAGAVTIAALNKDNKICIIFLF